MKKIIILTVIILVIGFFWFNGSDTPTAEDNASLPSDQTVEGTITTAPAPTTTAKELIILGSNFAFTPDTLEVKQGEIVRITFKNASGFHNLTLDEFEVATKQLKTGESETLEFVAKKTGSFEYYCSIGNHRAMGMKGTLTVK